MSNQTNPPSICTDRHAGTPPTHVVVVVEVLVGVDVVAALLQQNEVEEALRELGVEVGREDARGRVRRLIGVYGWFCMVGWRVQT